MKFYFMLALFLLLAGLVLGCKEEVASTDTFVEEETVNTQPQKNQGLRWGVHIGPHLTLDKGISLGPRIGWGIDF